MNALTRNGSPMIMRLSDTSDPLDLFSTFTPSGADFPTPDLSSLYTSSPIIPADSYNVPVSLSDLTIPDLGGGLTQYGPATSDSSWSSILTPSNNTFSDLLKGLTGALPSIATAYGSVAAANAAQRLPATAAPAAPLLPASNIFAGILSSPALPYLAIGAFVLLALKVNKSSAAPAHKSRKR